MREEVVNNVYTAQVCSCIEYDIIKLLDGPRTVNNRRYSDCSFLTYDTMPPYVWISCGRNMFSPFSALKCVE